MWPFTERKEPKAKNGRKKPQAKGGKKAPQILKRRIFDLDGATRVRGDYTLATSEAIYSAVSRISNTMMSIPIHLYKGMELQADHHLERLIGFAPNSHMTDAVFRQTMEVCRNTEGMGYALLVPNEKDTEIASIDVLDPAKVYPLWESETKELWYQLDMSDGSTTVVHNSRMLVIQHMSANGFKGIRPIDVLRGTLDYDRQMKEFSAEQMKGVKSSVMLTVPNNMQNDEYNDALVDRFLERYKRSGHSVIVLDGGLTASMMTSSPVDPHVLEVERISKNRVATVYNIPPHMLGDYSDTSYNTAEQSMQEFLQLTILPIVTQWESELRRKLLTFEMVKQGYSFRFDMTAQQRADTATTAEKYQKAIRSSWMTPNEIRQREGHPPVPYGDDLMASKDLVPLRSLMTQKPEIVKGETP